MIADIGRLSLLIAFGAAATPTRGNIIRVALRALATAADVAVHISVKQNEEFLVKISGS